VENIDDIDKWRQEAQAILDSRPSEYKHQDQIRKEPELDLKLQDCIDENDLIQIPEESSEYIRALMLKKFKIMDTLGNDEKFQFFRFSK